MQRLDEQLVNDILWVGINLGAAVEIHFNRWAPLLVNQLPGGIRIMKNETAKMQFTNTQRVRTRRQVRLKYRWLVVNPGYESHLGIEVLLGDTVPGINIEPVVGVREPSAKCGVIAIQTSRP